MAIVATVTGCKQVGENAYRDIHTSSVFEETRSIGDIISWAKATTGNEHISICEILLSEFTGSSI